MTCLSDTDRIERRIARALEALNSVPVGLAMPHEVHLCDGRRTHDNDPLIAMGIPATINARAARTLNIDHFPMVAGPPRHNLSQPVFPNRAR